MVANLSEEQKKEVETNRYWYHLTLFKETIEALYEICRVSRNIYGCKEILLYLTSAQNDFQTLIDSINVEEVWEHNEKPKNVAWEIKGASKAKTRLKDMETETVEGLHKKNEEKSLEVWQLVKSRSKRRKSLSSNEGGSDEGNSSGARLPKKPANVYDRLTSGQRSTRNPHSNMHVDEFKGNGITTGKLMCPKSENLMCPKSAMDLPQTKASMAKIAYSRQLLWQSHKQQLVEKKNAKRRQERILANLGNRRNSMPSLSNARKKSSENKVTNKELKGVESELASIHETAEEDKKEDLENVDNLSTHTFAGNFTTRSDPPGLHWELRELEDELSSLVEQERSLNDELSSLTQEIESLNDDDWPQVSLDVEDEQLEITATNFVPDIPDEKSSWREVVCSWRMKADEDQANQSAQKDTPVATPIPNAEPINRKPGDFAHVHEKLSSPSRRRLQEDLEKRNEERQQRAEELRKLLQEQTAQKLAELHARVKEVIDRKRELTERKAILMATKMQKAEQLRQKNLEEKVLKTKNEATHVLEINFIKTLSEANSKFELQLREQDREEKARKLMEEKVRKLEEKAAKEAAALDRRQTAERLKEERLKEQTLKQKERQEQAEAQRIELLEAVKKKQRERKMRTDERSAMEQAEQARMSQSLMERIQQKQEESSRRYEETIEQVRQKAIELCSPRLLNPWISLADCYPSPSDILYNQQLDSTSASGLGLFSRRKCICCNMAMNSDLHIIGHLCDEGHLQACGAKLSDVDYEFLKKELDSSIKEAENESTSSIESEKPEMDICLKEILKKRRIKIRQKFTRKKFVFDVQMVKSTEKIHLDKTFEKRLNEVLGILKENSKYNENYRMAFERNIVEIHKLFIKSNKDIREKIVIICFQSSLIEQLINYFINSHSSKSDSNIALTRLLGKVIHFVLDVLVENCLFSTNLFTSQFLMQMCDLLLLKTKSFHDSYDPTNSIKNWFTESILMIYLLHRWISFVVKNEENAQTGEDITLALSYLVVNGFSSYCESALAAVFNNSALIEVGELYNLKLNSVYLIFDLVSILITSTSSYLSHKNIDENCAMNDCNSLVSLFVPCTVFRYGQFVRPELTSNSLSSIIDDQILTLFIKLNEAKNCHLIVLHLLSSENGLLSIRLGFLLSNLVAYYVKRPFEEQSKKLLDKTIVAVGYYAVFSEKNRLFCTLGWQRSLLMNLCTLPFDYFSNAELRELILPTLIAIVLNNLSATEIIKNELSCSWFSSFIKELETRDQNDKNRISILLPENIRSKALEFFSKLS